jgi:hypothetical protein
VPTLYAMIEAFSCAYNVFRDSAVVMCIVMSAFLLYCTPYAMIQALSSVPTPYAMIQALSRVPTLYAIIKALTCVPGLYAAVCTLISGIVCVPEFYVY